jgi:hypothetical protein
MAESIENLVIAVVSFCSKVSRPDLRSLIVAEPGQNAERQPAWFRPFGGLGSFSYGVGTAPSFLGQSSNRRQRDGGGLIPLKRSVRMPKRGICNRSVQCSA